MGASERIEFVTDTATSSPGERAHLHQLLKQFHTVMLVMHADEGRLRTRPMALAHLDDDERVWFITGSESAKAHEIEADTRVHLVCQKGRSAYLSLSGHADLVPDRAKVAAAVWREPFKAWFPGGKDGPEIVLVSVQPEEGEYWDNEGSNKIKYLFETVRAHATGTKPEIKEGEQHGRVQM